MKYPNSSTSSQQIIAMIMAVIIMVMIESMIIMIIPKVPDLSASITQNISFAVF